MRIDSDVTRCQGYGNCADLDDEHFGQDEDGLVVIRRREVGDAARDTAELAVQSCPAQAIWLVADAG